MDDETKPGVERMKPCPFCQGRGSVSAERDTVRMTREEADAMRASAVKTPLVPRPDEEVTVELPFWGSAPYFGEDEDKTPVRAVSLSGRKQHDLLPIILALFIAALVVGGLGFALGYNP